MNTARPTIDLNADVGESYLSRQVGADETIIPLITSANIACGFHGGDPLTIEKTIALAISHSVQLGAHPAMGLDLEGFGRRPLSLSLEQVRSNVQYQVAALLTLVDRHGGTLKYVKPHGVLYHQVLTLPEVAQVVVAAIQSIHPKLRLLAANTPMLQRVCNQANQCLVAEAFADRRYATTGLLRSRAEVGAVIQNPREATRQAVQLATDQQIEVDGQKIQVDCKSLCIHGDHSNSPEILTAVRSGLLAAGCCIRPF